MPKVKTDYGTVRIPSHITQKQKSQKHTPKHTQKLRGPASKKGMAEELGKI